MNAQVTPPLAYATAPPPVHDAWRKTMGLNLRSEAAKFVLASFSLDVFSDQAPGSAVSLSAGTMERRFLERFARFLATEPEAHYALDHRRWIVLRTAKPVNDTALCDFGSEGELRKVTPVFDARQPVDPAAPGTLIELEALIAAYNKTRLLSEYERPRELARLLAAQPVATRLLAGTAISFDSGLAQGPGRFAPPDFRKRRGFGIGFMTAACRRSPDGRGIDLWLQCHHAGADGGPVQEMLDRLEKSWGVTAPLILPADNGEAGRAAAAHVEGEREVSVIADYVDFAPLAQLRREAASRVEGGVPLAGLFMWCLSHQPEFKGAGMNTAVDVPAAGDQPRAVDLVTVWPAKYHGRADAFPSFIRDLNTLFAHGRERKTKTWKSLVQLTSVPSLMSYGILKYMENGTREKFGTLTVSVIRGSKTVIAPMPDSGWDHGFIAVGTLGLAAESGPPVTPVSMKAHPDRIGTYPAAIRRAIAQCRDYV